MIIGVTGFFCSGKSVVAENLAGFLGFQYLDADKIVHELYRVGGEGWRCVRDSFGEEYLIDGEGVDRKKLAELVFGDADKLKLLNSLIHPLVVKELERISEGRDLVVEAFDFQGSGLGELVDNLVCVRTSRERIYEFAKIGRGLCVEEVERILGFQVEAEGCDFVLENGGDLDDLKAQAFKLSKQILSEIESG